jgi:hypothetical protein
MLKLRVFFHTGILILMLGSIPLQSQEVVINEFLASNSSINTDPDFLSSADWIELYNPLDETIDLSGYFLTDNLDDPGKWKFPDEVLLQPDGFLVIWADGKDTSLTGHHTNFKLSKDGEAIALYDISGLIMDSVVYGAQAQDISFGRQPDGGQDWYSFDVPSPGMSNTIDVYQKALNPVFSLQPGFYTEGQVLNISSDDGLAVIRYTTNGDEPTESSPVFTEPIPLLSREGDPNVFSEIRTNKDPYHWLPDWIPPAGEIFKGNVIRARAFRSGYHPSDIITSTYFVDENMDNRYPTIPVISINSDTRHLFNHETGIYVPGVYHKTGDNGSGNYFQDWEKPAHIEFFEPGGTLGFSQDVGISIQGGTSPASPQKGLHVIARAAYGKNRINYPLFENDPSSAKELTEFKRFIIRAWGSLITGSLLNDAYAHRLMAENDIDIQAYRPVVVFINGEYWGLQSLREANKNSWYYENHYDIDRDDPGYDILLHSESNGVPYAYADEGDANHWNAMMNYINTHDMNQKGNYDYLKTQMDVDNFIAYMGHCIYVSKWDWPNNNDASWRPRTIDGRWRWIQFDMETGFGVATSLGPEYAMLGPQLNMFDATIKGINIPNFGTYGPHPILSKIYNNEEFREAFIDWFIERFDNEFHPDTMNMILDEMAAEIRPYMPEYQHRWPFIGGIRGEWETSLENIKDFNNQRQDYVKAQLLKLLNTDKIAPVEYRLLQNYPNPFVTSTTIKYQLPVAGDATIKIYNAHGQMVSNYRQQHNSSGHFSLLLDARNYAGGIYFYSLEVDGYYEVKKMMLLR